ATAQRQRGPLGFQQHPTKRRHRRKGVRPARAAPARLAAGARFEHQNTVGPGPIFAHCRYAQARLLAVKNRWRHPMRVVLISLAVLLVVLMASAALLLAQSAPQGDAYAQKLDFVLANWEKVMTGIQSLSLECERVTKDKVFQNNEKFKG